MKTLSTLSVLFTLMVFTLTLLSCNKESCEEDYVWNQTGCADPWETNANHTEAELKLAITNYLKGKDIEATTVQLTFDKKLQQTCLACSCTTGTKIVVTVPKADAQAIAGLGFYQQD